MRFDSAGKKDNKENFAPRGSEVALISVENPIEGSRVYTNGKRQTASS